MSELAQVLCHVLPVDDPNALIGHTTGDDAAVYRLSDDRALVVTADFFTPIVDDPYDFGRIAATNALSDIYAMGARPLFVLNLVGFPRALLPEGILEEILRGGSDVTRSVGVPTLGGHSIDDAEPKYGLVAIGEVDPRRMITNADASDGDLLVLTKPLGSGVVATAIKNADPDAEVVSRAIEVMATLNAGAAEAMIETGVRSATDITGFGLLGHLHSMLKASGISARIDSGTVPLLPGARELVEAGHVPGGTKRNLTDLAGHVSFADSVEESTRVLLGDAQTSGGMLIAIAPDRLDALLAALDGRTITAAVVGQLLSGQRGTIEVV